MANCAPIQHDFALNGKLIEHIIIEIHSYSFGLRSIFLTSLRYFTFPLWTLKILMNMHCLISIYDNVEKISFPTTNHYWYILWNGVEGESTTISTFLHHHSKIACVAPSRNHHSQTSKQICHTIFHWFIILLVKG